jgi:hypothetical protein
MQYAMVYLYIGFGFMLSELGASRKSLAAIVKYKPVSIPIAAICVMFIWPIIAIGRLWRTE